MIRPEDIPADIWGTAVRYAGGEFAYLEVTKAISLAILAERERCAEIVRRGIPVIPHDGPTDDLQEAVYTALGHTLVDIRSGRT